MRCIAFILSIIVLALSCLPCADVPYGKTKEGEIRNGVTQASNECNDRDHEDGCSPFCHCSCCTGLLATIQVPYTPSVVFPERKSFTEFIPTDIIEISLPVWQPPQLAA